jgi:predicted nucleic acid-binding protein
VNLALIDTGPMVALFDPRDFGHRHYTGLLADRRWRLTTTWPCVVEVTHLLGARAVQHYLRWVSEGGVLVYPLDASDLLEMADMMARYTASPRTEMDFADASLVWLAQDINTLNVMTMDVRDFSRYRLPDGRAFHIH